MNISTRRARAARWVMCPLYRDLNCGRRAAAARLPSPYSDLNRRAAAARQPLPGTVSRSPRRPRRRRCCCGGGRRFRRISDDIVSKYYGLRRGHTLAAAPDLLRFSMQHSNIRPQLQPARRPALRRGRRRRSSRAEAAAPGQLDSERYGSNRPRMRLSD